MPDRVSAIDCPPGRGLGPAGIVVLTGLLSFLAVRNMFETTRWVQHTRDVLDASSTLMTSVLDAESASRGYVMTHDSTFLAPYHSAPERARTALVALRRLTVDNSKQQRRVDSIDAVVNRRLTLIDSTVDNERRGVTQIVRGAAAPRPGRDLMTNLRRLTDSSKQPRNHWPTAACRRSGRSSLRPRSSSSARSPPARWRSLSIATSISR